MPRNHPGTTAPWADSHPYRPAPRRRRVRPCWVREMSDDDAFMELVLSNAQSELSALERGMHALLATEKGSTTGRSVAAYAKVVGRQQPAVAREVYAAEVAMAVIPHGITAAELDGFDRHASEIHAAPEAAWPALVRHLLKPAADGKTWTVKQTQDAVRKIKEIEVADAVLRDDRLRQATRRV